MGARQGDLVLTTMMEHHSNDLPRRSKAAAVYAGGADRRGALDLDDLETKLRYGRRIKTL